MQRLRRLQDNQFQRCELDDENGTKTTLIDLNVCEGLSFGYINKLNRWRNVIIPISEMCQA